MKISAIEYNDALDDDEAKGNTLEDSVQVCKWLEEAGVDAIHVSSGSYFPHPKNPAGDLPIDELKKTYDTLISSGLLTFRNYLFFRFRTTGEIFQRRWEKARGDKTLIEGMNLPNAHRIKQAVSIPGAVHRRISDGGDHRAGARRRAVRCGDDGPAADCEQRPGADVRARRRSSSASLHVLQ